MDTKMLAILIGGGGAIWLAMSLLKKEGDEIVPPIPPPIPPPTPEYELKDLTASYT